MPHDTEAWRQQLGPLDGLPLLALKGKQPFNAITQNPKGWTTEGFPADVIAACTWATGVGTRTGQDAGGLIAFDLDGDTAQDLARQQGCDPDAAGTWVVRRSDVTDRVKTLFMASPEQSQKLGQCRNTYHTKDPWTDDDGNEIKGEGAELYHGVGQVVLLGNHPKGGQYVWRDGEGPGNCQPLPEEWFQFALLIQERNKSKATNGSGKAPRIGVNGWSKIRGTCPICGRDSHPICGTNQAGDRISCYDGVSFSFDKAHPGLKVGSTITGKDGKTWALTAITWNAEIGADFGSFKIHEPLTPDKRRSKPRPGVTPPPSSNGSGPPVSCAGSAVPLQNDDDLPPGPTPERLAEIEQQIAALERDAQAATAAAPDRESVLLAIADLSVKWTEDPDQVEAVANVIGHYLAASEDLSQEIPLRDRLCAAAKGAPKKHLQMKIEHAYMDHRAALGWYGTQIGVLIAERDAREIAIQQRQKQQQQAQQQEQHRQRLQQATGIDAVLLAVGEGWTWEDESAPNKVSKLTPGKLADRVRAELGDRLGFDEMRLLPAVDRQALPPNILQLLYVKLSSNGWDIRKEQAVDALSTAAFSNSFHPVRLFLQDIENNDTIEPLDLDEFYGYFLVTDPQQQRYLLLMLLAAVWRAMEPGCSLKICVILQGPQTTYKSESLKQLCGPEWFGDTRQEQDKDTLLALYASWIYELGEIDALMDKRHAGDLKNLVSPSGDLLRPPFWSAMCRFERASIFVGTTNKTEFFTDETGNHRYPVVRITEPIDLEGITTNRSRIWKAALKLYRDGVKPWLSQDDLRDSELHSQQFCQQDPWLPMVQQWIDGTTIVMGRNKEGAPITEYRQAPDEFTTTTALIDSGVARPDGLLKPYEGRMAAVLRSLGYEQGRQCRRAGTRLRPWRLGATSPAAQAQPGVPSGGAPSQAAQPVTSPDPAGCDGSEASQDQGSELLSQASQPFTSSGNGDKDTQGRVIPVCVSLPLCPSRETLVVTPVTGGRSLAAQAMCPSQAPCDRGEAACDVVTEPVTQPNGTPPPHRDPPWLAQVLSLRAEHPEASPQDLARMLWNVHRVAVETAVVAAAVSSPSLCGVLFSDQGVCGRHQGCAAGETALLP